jgi:hypothetical protein
MAITQVKSMSIFKQAHEILETAFEKHTQLTQLVLAIVGLLLLIYFCVLTIFNNQSLNEKLVKVTNERTYVLNSIDRYKTANEAKTLDLNVGAMNQYFINDSQSLKNFSIQTSGDIFKLSFAHSEDFQLLSALFNRIALIKNLEIEEIMFLSNNPDFIVEIYLKPLK